MSLAIAIFLRFAAWACFVLGTTNVANTVVRYARSDASRCTFGSGNGGFLGFGEIVRWLLTAAAFTVWSLFK